jgi:hypothetical protein
MAHYFDDIFTRHRAQPKRNKSRPNMRRSSTARSIGGRSDFDVSVNGDLDEAQSNSVFPDTEEMEREREEADAHTANYVSEQLSRMRTRKSAEFEMADEFEAQLDER